MKKLLLLISLLLATNAWALEKEDEFPIELTCEFATLTLFLSLSEDPKKSYFTVLSYLPDTVVRRTSKKMNKKNKLRKYEIDDSQIRIGRLSLYGHNIIYINRYSGKAELRPTIVDGYCHKGLREYKERKF